MRTDGNYRHGAAGASGAQRTREYNSWRAAKRRVSDPHYEHYDRYGGRGIAMCPEWLSSFRTFLIDMGPKPGPEFTLERIDNDGDYRPGNCRWATKSEQALNRG